MTYGEQLTALHIINATPMRRRRRRSGWGWALFAVVAVYFVGRFL